MPPTQCLSCGCTHLLSSGFCPECGWDIFTDADGNYDEIEDAHIGIEPLTDEEIKQISTSKSE